MNCFNDFLQWHFNGIQCHLSLNVDDVVDCWTVGCLQFYSEEYHYVGV